MVSRRNLFYFFSLTLVFWTLGSTLVWVMDPYHLFHETRWNRNRRAFKILDSYPHRDTFDELVAAEY